MTNNNPPPRPKPPIKAKINLDAIYNISQIAREIYDEEGHASKLAAKIRGVNGWQEWEAFEVGQVFAKRGIHKTAELFFNIF